MATKVKKCLTATFTVVVSLLGLLGAFSAIAPSATASSSGPVLYRPFPEGLPSDNANLAWSMIVQRASWDPGYANVIASQTGAKTFVPLDYKPKGYAPQAIPGTTNSGITATGNIVPLADHDGSQYVRVLEVLNWKTMKIVEFMVRCGNPRLYKVVPIPWKPFAKGTVLAVHKTVNENIVHVCPSGQTVYVAMTTTLNGIVHAKTWGQVQGNLNSRLKASVNAAVKSEATITCGKIPTKEVVHVKVKVIPETETVKKYRVVTLYHVVTISRHITCPSGTKLNGAGNCVILKVTCPAGFVKNSAGNCVVNQQSAQQNCESKGGTYNSSDGTCTIVQVVGNCSTVTVINGNNVVINENTTGNCNSSPTPPPSTTPPSTTTPPPPTPVCYLNGVAEYTLPSGYQVQNGQCVPIPPPPPTPVCYLNGVAEYTLPSGYQVQNGQCVPIPPPPTTTTPPAPPTVSLNQPQHAIVGGETQAVCATVSGRTGDTYMVTFNAAYGSLNVASETDTLKWCSTYTSPGEIPSSGVDTITVSVYDQTTGQAAQDSVSFPIISANMQ